MIIVGLFSLPLSTVCAQTMFSVEKGLEKYALPLTSSIKVGENGCFTAYYDNRTPAAADNQAYPSRPGDHRRKIP